MIAEFKSLTSFLDTCRQPMKIGGTYRKSREVSRGDWFMSKDYDEAEKFAREGWKKGREDVEAMMASFAAVVASVKRQEIRYELSGGTVDIGRYLSGEPECFAEWTDSESDIVGPKMIHIVFNFTVSGGISTETIRLRGAAIAALIQAFELAGRRVKLTLVVCVQPEQYGFHDKLMLVRINAKEYDQPMQIDQVAFTLAHAAMLRRFYFSFVEQLPSDYAHAFGANSSYGHIQEVPLTEDRGDIYMPQARYSDPQWDSKARAIQWVKDTLRQFNVTLDEK